MNFTDPSKLPRELEFLLSSTHTNPKTCQKVLATSLGLDFKVYYYGSPYDQGQLTEVPRNFKNFGVKVVGETLYACSFTSKSKLQSNGIFKLGLVSFFVLSCDFNPKKFIRINLGLLLALKLIFFALAGTRSTIQRF